MRIDSSGNVGIGTSSPNSSLRCCNAIRAANCVRTEKQGGGCDALYIWIQAKVITMGFGL